jgi:uncharacterized protein YdhG (YjbR/CyaY superfamily)
MATMSTTKFKTIDKYISAFPSKVKTSLETLRKAIKQVAPDADEIISYNMPAFKFYGRILVYFAAHTKHIGFYPGNRMVNEVFKDDLTSYETSKGTIKFPFEKPIPVSLVKKIVKYRVNENIERANSKQLRASNRK